MTGAYIPKDLTRVKAKFALGLTKRQAACFMLSLRLLFRRVNLKGRTL